MATTTTGTARALPVLVGIAVAALALLVGLTALDPAPSSHQPHHRHGSLSQRPLIGPAEIAAYNATGYVILPAVFSPEEVARALDFSIAEIEALESETRSDPALRRRLELVGQVQLNPLGAAEQAPATRVVKVEGARDFQLLSHLFALTADPRLVEAAATLLGEPVTLFKDKLIFKAPGGPGFSPHQDMVYGFHRFHTNVINAFVALDDHRLDNGCLQVVPGWHRRGLLVNATAGLERPSALSDVPEDAWEYVELKRGSVLLFDGFVPHRSAPNTHPTDFRRVYIPTYGPAREGADYDAYYDWWCSWLEAGLPANYHGPNGDRPSKLVAGQ